MNLHGGWSPHELARKAAGPMHPPFREIDAKSRVRGVPFGLSLGPPVAPGNDWSLFAEHANARGRVGADQRVHIVWTPVSSGTQGQFLESIDAQDFAGQVSISVHGPFADQPSDHPRIVARHRDVPWTAGAIATEADCLIFVSGSASFDRFTLERIVRLVAINPLLTVPLYEGALVSSENMSQRWAHHPYRQLAGLNLALDPRLLQRAGGAPQGYANHGLAGRELAFHCYQLGAYFAPVAIPMLETGDTSEADASLYRSRVPQGLTERSTAPFISVLLPARLGAATVAELTKSFSSLSAEILICAEGPPAKAIAALADGGRGVRIVDTSTGDPVGTARGIYVAEITTPGFAAEHVAKAVQHLEERSAVACCYIADRETRQQHEALLEDGHLSLAAEVVVGSSFGGRGLALFRRAAWERIERDPVSTAPALAHRMLQLASAGALHRLPGLRVSRVAQAVDAARGLLAVGKRAAWTRRELERRGLDRYWTRQLRRKPAKRIVFWPDYSRENPYQRLLYGPPRAEIEYLTGEISAALQLMREGGSPLIFHLHWINRITQGRDEEAARKRVASFLAKLTEFKRLGGRVIWTIHNVTTHRGKYPEVELGLANALVELADTIHLHSSLSMDEIAAHHALPREKVRIAPLGNYIDVYADFVDQRFARETLGIAADEDVLLHFGKVKGYKGLAQVPALLKRLLPERPRLRLIVAGPTADDVRQSLFEGLSDAEKDRITLVDRFIGDDELQLFFHAADAGLFPFSRVLTSSSVVLALSLGLPIVAPAVGMIEETVGEPGPDPAAFLYPPGDPDGLETAMRQVLTKKDQGRLDACRRAARQVAERNAWRSFPQAMGD